MAHHMVTSLRMLSVMMISWWHRNHEPREECWMCVSYGQPSDTTMEVDFHTLMEIDHTRFQPQSEAQRQHRWDNGLCLYCGNPGHVICHYPVRGP